MAQTDVCLCADAKGLHDPNSGRCTAIKRVSYRAQDDVPCGCLEFMLDRKATWAVDRDIKRANGGKEYRTVQVLQTVPGTMIVKAEGGGYRRVPTDPPAPKGAA